MFCEKCPWWTKMKVLHQLKMFSLDSLLWTKIIVCAKSWIGYFFSAKKCPWLTKMTQALLFKCSWMLSINEIKTKQQQQQQQKWRNLNALMIFYYDMMMGRGHNLTITDPNLILLFLFPFSFSLFFSHDSGPPWISGPGRANSFGENETFSVMDMSAVDHNESLEQNLWLSGFFWKKNVCCGPNCQIWEKSWIES